MYKTQLPFVLVFNKTDVVSEEVCVEWLRDFETFQQALMQQDESYMNSLMNSMSLMLDEFYSQLRVCGVSSVTGRGIDEFFSKVEEARGEYFEEYLPMLLSKMQAKKDLEDERKAEQIEQLAKDMGSQTL
ncbi:GPN-loop GTPase 1 [Smittium culicis]|uniref:GPN-loop GTPase n=1 Tax=Smittium culicis TaxID=133412 RepID=A0A1R1XX82_9FUNG|nr:GPN-loop GTPase 1 [Smittium culicis]